MVPIVRCSFKLCTPKVSQKYGHTSTPSWKIVIKLSSDSLRAVALSMSGHHTGRFSEFLSFLDFCYQLVLQTSAVNFCCKLLLISSAIVFLPKLLLLTSAIIFCYYLLLLYLHLQLRNLYQCCCMDSEMTIQKSYFVDF